MRATFWLGGTKRACRAKRAAVGSSCAGWPRDGLVAPFAAAADRPAQPQLDNKAVNPPVVRLILQHIDNPRMPPELRVVLNDGTLDKLVIPSSPRRHGLAWPPTARSGRPVAISTSSECFVCAARNSKHTSSSIWMSTRGSLAVWPSGKKMQLLTELLFRELHASARRPVLVG
ncbi:hypothetical protein C8J57DRAFT_1704894 [Mycena rebaudengoi]|nr:hypothetical protein C8J57DRAFT_1704894 [Mycena rebaudengoi]